MKKLADLRAERGQINDEMIRIAEAEEFDQKAYDDKKAAFDAISMQIAALEEAQARQAALAKPAQAEKAEIPAPTTATVPACLRTRPTSLRGFRGENAVARAYRFGQFMQAAVFGKEKALDWCRENGVLLTKAHSEGIDPAGGVFVPEEFVADIIDLRDEYGMFRRLCRTYPMGRDTIRVPRRTGGLTAYPVGEAAAATESTAGWDDVELTAKKWMVYTLMSSELDEDAVVSIGDILMQEMAYAFAVAEDGAGFSGDGTTAYHGVKGLLTLFEGGIGSLVGSPKAASNHDTFAEIDGTDLATLMATLPQYVYKKGRPSFFCSQVAWALVFQRLIAASGGISKDDATGTVVYRYLGFPVEITPSMPTTTGDLSNKAMILFGDVGMAASFGDRHGMAVARSTDFKFNTDQIAIKATERFAINVHDIGNTSVAGPVVALIGE